MRKNILLKPSFFAALLTALLVGAAAIANDRSPPPIEQLIGDNGASTEKGKYLATASNCATCHTAENGEPYAGGRPFKTEFGVIYATNITQHREAGIGDWSFEDFYQSLKHGVRPDGTHLYPAFPYTDFAKLTNEDIASLYLYLETIKPVARQNQQNDLKFPYRYRALLGPWKMLFHRPDTFTPSPDKSEAWNRGAYLVNGPGHCGACHTPRNFLGAENEALFLTGGIYYDKVKLGHYRRWSTVNLTPAGTGLASWTRDDLATYLKEGQSHHSVVHGPMKEVVMNSTRYLTDDDLFAIATYLTDIPANSQQASSLPDEQTMAAGEIAYTVHCGSCHLPTGLGDQVLGVPLAGSPLVQAPDPAALINVILYGPHLPPPPFEVDRTRMKMLGKKLSDKEVALISSYVRNSFGNKGSAVKPEQVKAQR